MLMHYLFGVADLTTPGSKMDFSILEWIQFTGEMTDVAHVCNPVLILSIFCGFSLKIIHAKKEMKIYPNMLVTSRILWVRFFQHTVLCI